MRILVLNYRDGYNFDIAVASPSKRERPSVKIAHITLRKSVSEEFAIDYNLTDKTWYGRILRIIVPECEYVVRFKNAD